MYVYASMYNSHISIFFSHRSGAQCSLVPQRGTIVGPGPNVSVYKDMSVLLLYDLAGEFFGGGAVQTWGGGRGHGAIIWSG